MTPTDIAAARKAAEEARQRADLASAAPWTMGDAPAFDISMGSGDDERPLKETWFWKDAWFIVNARRDIPTLAVTVLEMANEIERLRKIEAAAWDLSSQVYPTEEQRAALYFALRTDLPK